MNMRIWKYTLPVQDHFAIDMPDGAQVLSVGTQYDRTIGRDGPVLWAMVDRDAKLKPHHFAIIGTGHPFEAAPGKFVGTFQLRNGLSGEFVGHLFDMMAV